MWGGSLTSSTPFLVQVTFGVVPVVEFAVQYNWITDCCTTLWTPPLFSKSRFGSEVTVSRALTAVGKDVQVYNCTRTATPYVLVSVPGLEQGLHNNANG